MKFYRKKRSYFEQETGTWYRLAPVQISFWTWVKELFIPHNYYKKSQKSHDNKGQLDLFLNP